MSKAPSWLRVLIAVILMTLVWLVIRGLVG
jgi:hypothetical protein